MAPDPDVAQFYCDGVTTTLDREMLEDYLVSIDTGRDRLVSSGRVGPMSTYVFRQEDGKSPVYTLTMLTGAYLDRLVVRAIFYRIIEVSYA